MSCNYCSYQKQKRDAESRGMVVTLSARRANFGLGGLNTYVHPPNINLRDVPDSNLEQYNSHSWYMSVPDSCCCGDTDFDIPDYPEYDNTDW